VYGLRVRSVVLTAGGVTASESSQHLSVREPYLESMPENDPDDVMDAARERQHQRAEHTEDVLRDVDALVDAVERERKFPVSSEEVGRTYGDQESDLPNESESLGSALDRIAGRDEEYASVDEAREALLNEITGEAGGPEEYNDERALGDLDDATQEPRDEDEQPHHL
jgi:hypothetical protein